jgi:hypothetical protein
MSACMTCGAEPCCNLSFCAACREADQRRACGEQPCHIGGWCDRSPKIPRDWDGMSLDALWQRFNERRPTSQTTIEAIMWTVRERGVAALMEPTNIERLARCDAAARAEINRRVARLIVTKEIAR